MDKYEIIDPVFDTYIIGNAHLKQLATGFDWVEGPVWFGDADCLLFSDIPNNVIHRWNRETGLSTYRNPSNFANGHTRDRQGRLVSCEHGTRRVTRTEFDGTITVIADSFQGKRLNSPNDVVVKSDGSIWFTDPHYGIICDYEGHRGTEELPCNVYRVDPDAGTMDAVLTDFDCPNGLAFSPDESVLYVADTGRRFDTVRTRHIRAFAVEDDRGLSGGDVFHKVSPGAADGFRLDVHGNIWTSAADGVHCIAPDGRLLGKVFVPELVSNVCFGGRAKHQLFITATTSVYMIALGVSGA
ncbi:SMP-30/gluconolactonase/LRE family protein [Marinovum sp. 2_MG-2023]|uniref:SMP-30/gluconolactonase/LRE family protein n=1 Tax=unclassified Marinovum TaxID=2647166 RepID=UPI0026E2A117|nr:MULTISPECIES: SMP-30/gluconolactonase/LRE family protein [unclassified Marinovum]MDO6730538.1 SMP-30/gluconolactonase/LRE family protein [Marinovum sp. 2_MG-2023]MDO6778688.1 SMP-30/gluconolactonase/LRE family protein [Marinovum sp. 1_MG-2023]